MSKPLSHNTEQTLKRIAELIDTQDADLAALESAKMLLKIFAAFTAKICTDLDRPTINIDLILRCIARKAEESLRAIVALVESGQDYYAMPLLRPLCEEYLLASLLVSLPEEGANSLLADKTVLDILEGLSAQASFFPKAAEIFGFDDFTDDPDAPERLQALAAEIVTQKAKLRSHGEKLGWGRRSFPSARWMAKATGNLPVYEFFYHGASSAVHASLHHLGRMVWGDSRSGKYSISNANFGQFYRRFALIYGCWLCSATISLVRERFGADWPTEYDDSFSILFAFCVKPSILQKAPGIVTEYELRSKRAV